MNPDQIKEKAREIAENNAFKDEYTDLIEDIAQALTQAIESEREECAKVAHSFRRGNLKVMELKALLETEPSEKVKILPDGTIKNYDPAVAIATAIRARGIK